MSTRHRSLLVGLAVLVAASLLGAAGTTWALWATQSNLQTATGYGFARYSFGAAGTSLTAVALGDTKTVTSPQQLLDDLKANGKSAAAWTVESGSTGFLRTDGLIQLTQASGTAPILAALTKVASAADCTAATLTGAGATSVQLTGTGGYHATEQIQTSYLCLRLSTSSYSYTNTAMVTGTASGLAGNPTPTAAVTSNPSDPNATWTQSVWKVPTAVTTASFTLTYTPQVTRALS